MGAGLNNQAAKADAGKLQLTLVPKDLIRTVAILEKYEKDVADRLSPELIRKTKKINHDWKGLFRCPYCGNEFEAYISNVINGRQHSCGCMKGKFSVESKGTHGGSGTRLFRIYMHIKERCERPYCKEYKWYGARGIKCEFESFEEFRDFALSHGYNDNLTVERIDVNGNYSKDNITFIPQSWQGRNTRKSVKITYKGLTLCAAEWAELLGFNPDTLTKRKRSGWSDEKTLETRAGNALDVTLIPTSIIDEIRRVRLFGVKKYKDPDNWRRVEPQRYWDACVRHIIAALDDYKKTDEESGLLHLSHAATNLAFLLEMMKEESDDNSN